MGVLMNVSLRFVCITWLAVGSHVRDILHNIPRTITPSQTTRPGEAGPTSSSPGREDSPKTVLVPDPSLAELRGAPLRLSSATNDGGSVSSSLPMSRTQSSEYLPMPSFRLMADYSSPPLEDDVLGEAVPLSALKPLAQLGAGEFCTVHRATLRGSMVALKRLRPARLALGDSSRLDLGREIAVLSRVEHPNIIRLVAHGVDGDGVPFCCLEMFSQPLSALLPSGAEVGFFARQREARKWPLARGLSVGLQLAEALRYCHDEFMPGYRLLHRDLKPANVGIMPDGRAVLRSAPLFISYRPVSASLGSPMLYFRCSQTLGCCPSGRGTRPTTATSGSLRA